MARATSADKTVRSRITHIQRELFVVGGELATSPDHRETLRENFGVVTPDMTERLETWIDEIDSQIELPNEFILPGGSPASAAIDLARTVTRRAEREVVGLQRDHPLANDEILRYLNRLSDFLFMLGRFADREGTTKTRSGAEDASTTNPGDEKA
jgi:cob(I)alamin adenosyltransferase